MRSALPGTGAVLATAAMLLTLAGCGGSAGSGPSASGDGRPTIVTDLYPTTFAVQQVVGDAARVVQLTPTGVEPHDYELSPAQVAEVADADLVAYLPGMIPAVEQAAAQEAAGRSVDVTSGITKLGSESDPGGADPHVWLDPANMAAMGATVAAALAERGIPADAGGLADRMAGLDQELGARLAQCRVRTMVVTHEAFGYLAHAYGFTQVALSGFSPQAEPSPARLAEIAGLVQSEGITTVYSEVLVPPDAADTIAAETGASTAVLDPIEGDTGGRGYVALMRANADTLHAGQDCA